MTDLLEVAGVLAVSALAVHELATGATTLGGILVFVGYLSQLYGPVQSLGDLTTSVYAATAGAERVAELLDLPSRLPEPSASTGASHRPRPNRRGGLELRGVSVRYPGADHAVFDDLNLRIAPGRHVAVVGPSGAGKSTLVALLLRLIDPDRGVVLLDGTDLRQIPAVQRRRLLCAALQDPSIPDSTVHDTLRWAAPDAQQHTIRRAAALADADAFIQALDNGYSTRTGTRGSAMSGGQRQRLSLARAIVADSPVLVLDEPTTGLDAATGARVLARIAHERRNRTTIFVTHDPRVIACADEVVELTDGRATTHTTETTALSIGVTQRVEAREEISS